MDAIAVDGLEKTYGKDIRALDGVSFSVREGENLRAALTEGNGAWLGARSPPGPAVEPRIEG